MLENLVNLVAIPGAIASCVGGVSSATSVLFSSLMRAEGYELINRSV